MSASLPRHLAHLLFAASAALGLAACAPAPLYKPTPSSINLLPSQVTPQLQAYQGRDVVWAGQIVSVSNFRDHSEIQVLAYPSDHSQRPELKRPADSRFVAVLAGFVEPMNYPIGAPITIAGKVVGTRSEPAGEMRLIVPLVNVAQAHRWNPAEMDAGHPHFQFGLGAGIGFH